MRDRAANGCLDSGADRDLAQEEIPHLTGAIEERLAVRLLQRSTRSVSVTEVGAAFFTHCESMAASAKSAFEVAEQANAKPSGRLRVSCPIVSQLPFHACEEALRSNRLVALLPDHKLPDHQLHAVYPTRRGMVPAVKAFVGMLATTLPRTMARAKREFHETVVQARARRG